MLCKKNQSSPNSTMEDKTKESEEKKIPVLTVFKKGLMFKNIFLLDKATSPLLISNPQSLNSVEPHHPKDDDEEILLVGRHPDCSIVLEHPSISRFHLRIYLQPSLQKLFVVDLSSAHGTWVSDTKIEPRVRVELSEGDTLKLGVSTRTYRLHWVSLSSVLDGGKPLVSQNLETLAPPEDGVLDSEQYLSPLIPVFDDSPISGSVSDVESPVVFPNSGILVLPGMKKREGVLENEYLNSAEQNSSPLSHVSGVNSLVLSDSENQLRSEEKEEGGLMENKNLVSFEQHLCPLGSVTNVGSTVVLPNSETLALPEVKEEEGVLENENLNSAEQRLSPRSYVYDDDENTLCLSNFENDLSSEEIEEVGVFENENLNSAEQRLSPRSYVYDDDDENTLGLSNYDNDLSSEEIEEVGVFENTHPISSEQHLSQPGRVFDAGNSLILQQHLNGAFECENSLAVWNSESSLGQERVVEGMLDNEVLISSEKHLNPLSCVFDVESPLVSPSPENTLLPPEMKEVKGVLTNENLISFGQHLSPSAPLLLNFTEENFSFSFFCVEELGSESSSSSSLPNNQHRLEKELNTPSLWSRRGKPPSLIRIATACGKRKTMEVTMNDENGSDNQNKMDDESVTKVLFSGSDAEEEIFSANNENYTPRREVGSESVEKKGKSGEVEVRWSYGSLSSNRSEDKGMAGAEVEIFSANNENYTPGREVGSESVEKGKSGEVEVRWSYGSLSSTRSEDKGMSTFSEKENLTPIVSHDSRLRKPLSESRLGQEADMIRSNRMEGRMPFQCLVVNSVDNSKSEARVPVTDTTPNSSVNCDRDELTPKVLFSCSDGEEEIFIPYKENCSPKAGLGSQSIEKGTSVELELEKSYGSSTFLENENPTQVVLHDSGMAKPLSVSQEADIIVSERRVPFQNPLGNSINNSKIEVAVPITSTTGCKSSPIYDKQSYRNANKMWYMVADTNCLLNKESRRSLQLLQGLKGTQLIIPRMVIRELDCLQRRGRLLKKTTEASSALEWIEECTAKTKFWIHVQSSIEEPIAPTPPASPSWLSWLSEGVYSPTAEDRAFDCALLFKRIKKDDGYVVLLSNDISLKIKAMEEGMLCETASEFRESLVNPYSERFLWVGSIPRGPTWCCLEEPGLRENCYSVPVKKIVFKAAENANKGLKLLLFHNYLNSGPMISVS